MQELSRKVAQLVEDPSIECLNSSALKKNINVLHCLQFSRAAWDLVTPQIVRNCWRKAGFKPATHESAEADVADPADELLREPLSEEEELLQQDVEELNIRDADALTSSPPIEDAESIVAALVEDQASVADGDVDEDDEATVPPRPPTTAELFGAFNTLRQALYVAKADINLHRQVDGLEGFLANAKGQLPLTADNT